jgi:hypothetical protein
MSQFVSLIVFIGTMIWTWSLFNSDAAVSLETHAGIQSKFITLIEKSVRTSAPTVTGFEILSMHTKNIDDRQVSAHFSYRYKEQLTEGESATQVLSGEARLVRALSEDPESDRWLVQSVKTEGQQVDFQQGLTVDPSLTPTDDLNLSTE